MARAIIKPPMSRNTVEFMYCEATLLLSEIPNNGNKASGIRAVAAKGIASVIQKIDIMTAMAAIPVVCRLLPKSENIRTAAGIVIPKASPVFFNRIYLPMEIGAKFMYGIDHCFNMLRINIGQNSVPQIKYMS